MTGTGQKEKEKPISHRMTDDRSTMLYILEEPQMRGEGDRLRTFQNWPADAPVTSGDLAKAGFFFLGPGDKVKCFCCGGVLRYWVNGDSPTLEHKRHFPTCSFMLGRAVGNILLYIAPGSSDSVDGQLLSQLQRMTVDDHGSAGQAVYPEMEAEDSRLTTFHNWPTGASVQPDVLARAGFFYTGHGDNVKCFYCDGGLRNWEPEDDPWQEHAKWFPRCGFLIQSRGQEYVSDIQDAHFHLGETVGGSQTPTAREISSGNVQSIQTSTSTVTSSDKVEEAEQMLVIALWDGRREPNYVNPGDVVGGLGASSAMLSPVVQSVLQMGFEASLVESLVQTKYLLTGRHYTSVSELVTDVLQAEEEDRQRGQQSREPEVRQGPSAGSVRTHTPVREKAVGDPSPEELLRQLQEERTCKVCMDKLVSVVFIPCGHLVVCSDCAASLRHCPICRAVIRGSVRTFMS